MAEIDFERRLERLFAEVPDFADAGAFAGRVEQRLNRGWTARRWLIGAAGVGGGVIGASQLMMANVFQRMESAGEGARMLSADSGRALSGLGELASRQEWMQVVNSGGAVVWIASGLAILAMGFVLTRVIEEI